MAQPETSLPRPHPWLYLCLATLFWAATILPCISIKGWFYLDEPTQLVIAMHGGWIGAPDLGMGRYLPVFQAWRKLVYTLAGASPAGFYFCQSLLFLGVLLLAVDLMRRVSGNAALPRLLVILGLMSYSLAEPAYTLGKHEPVLVLLLMLYLCALQRLEADPAPGASPSARWKIAAACFILCTLAMWNKETTPAFVAFLPPLMLLPSARENLQTRLRRFSPAFAASIAGIIAAKAPVWIARHSAPPLTGEVYASFTPTLQSIAANARYYLGQTPDFFLVIGLALVLLALGFKRHRAAPAYRFAAGAALTALTYLGGLLLWRWGSVYYSYPPQWLAALAVAAVSAPLLAGAKAERRGAGAGCTLFILAKLAALVPFIYIANAQRIEAEVYSRAIHALAAQPGIQNHTKETRLYLENWNLISEPPIQTQLFLQNILHTRVRVLGGSELVTGRNPDHAAAAALFRQNDLSPSDPRLQPRAGDYVLTLLEHFPGRYNSRAVSPCVYQNPKFATATGLHWKLISRFSRQLRCPVALLHPFQRRPIGSRYELHRIEPAPGPSLQTAQNRP